jgi:hypothetical protein
MRTRHSLPILAALALASLAACSDSSDHGFQPNMPDQSPTPAGQVGSDGGTGTGQGPNVDCKQLRLPRCNWS